MNEETLSHYGVLGMKWGVRKKTESSSGGGLRSVEEKRNIGESINAEAFKKERAKAEKAAEKERKKHESELKKAAKAAAAAAKKGARAVAQKHAANKAKRAQEATERARKKLENQKLRDARKAETERKKKQKEAERAEKKQKELDKQRVPKGGITAAMRKETPRRLSSTDLIEQNKRLNLEKQNYELKQKLKEYENQNRSVLSKTADLFIDEARINLTKYAANTAANMLTAALDSKLKGTEYEGIAAMAKNAFNINAIIENAVVKKKDKKKDNN